MVDSVSRYKNFPTKASEHILCQRHWCNGSAYASKENEAPAAVKSAINAGYETAAQSKCSTQLKGMPEELDAVAVIAPMPQAATASAIAIR